MMSNAETKDLKAAVLELVDDLPNDATWEDVMYTVGICFDDGSLVPCESGRRPRRCCRRWRLPAAVAFAFAWLLGGAVAFAAGLRAGSFGGFLL